MARCEHLRHRQQPSCRLLISKLSPQHLSLRSLHRSRSCSLEGFETSRLILGFEQRDDLSPGSSRSRSVCKRVGRVSPISLGKFGVRTEPSNDLAVSGYLPRPDDRGRGHSSHGVVDSVRRQSRKPNHRQGGQPLAHWAANFASLGGLRSSIREECAVEITRSTPYRFSSSSSGCSRSRANGRCVFGLRCPHSHRVRWTPAAAAK